MPIADHRATGQGVFGIKRHVKSGLQKGVRTAVRCGLGLPARMPRISDRRKTAVIVPLNLTGGKPPLGNGRERDHGNAG